MGNLPQIDNRLQGPLTVRVRPQWMDHHFRGRPVLPAVAAMQVLAGQVQQADPEIKAHCIQQARFPKFLEIPAGHDTLELIQSLTPLAGGGLHATLGTRLIKGSAGITRTIIHAEMNFGPSPEAPQPLPLDMAAAVAGCSETIDPEIIYKELVPFGPCFRSIYRPLVLSPDGALARVRAPQPSSDDPASLGSPYPLDGAFHAACVWGQRHAGIVAFPVGFASRCVFIPTIASEPYWAHVTPVTVSSRQLIFDIHLLDARGRVREEILGVDMRDVSRGTWQPPAWIQADTPKPLLPRWADLCQGVVLLERGHLAPFAHLSLTEAEARRLVGKGKKRRNGYISARLASKRLWRQLASHDRLTPPTTIETITDQGPQPALPPVGGKSFYCSVAHDQDLCIAVADHRPVGVDLENITARALDTSHLFMQASEQHLMHTGIMDKAFAALCIWSIKEAASKALDMPLAQAWEQIEVVALGEKSILKTGAGKEAIAYHDTVAGHLATLVILETQLA